MEQRIEIKKFRELFSPTLSSNEKVVDYKTKPLTKPGENYGSLILAVEVTVRDSDNKEYAKYVVAKMCPESDIIKKMFQIHVTFKKEASMYTTIIPTLLGFQRQKHVTKVMDFFPKCYAARLSLDPLSDVVDDDAVILLENLHKSDFATGDRLIGLDFDAAAIVVKDLAVFHATVIAYKVLHPVEFKQIILPLVQTRGAYDDLEDDTKKGIPMPIIDTLKENEACLPLLSRVTNGLDTGFKHFRIPLPAPEPFATIIHNDLWVNNTMLKFEHNKAVGSKFVDFQIIDYNSPARDLIFFIYSSLPMSIIVLYYDKLIEYYYDTFIKTLEELQCDTSPFTFELFQEEIDFVAKNYEFFHIMVMFKPILTPRGIVKELKDLTPEEIFSNENLSDSYKRRVSEVAIEFARHNWI